MQLSLLNKFSKPKQYLVGIIAVIFVSAICYILSSFIGYRIVALILLFTVSVIAMFFDIYPVLIVAILSVLIWDYFFIPPKFTFLIDNAEDALMLGMYFAIAMINAVLTFKNKQWEKIARQREEKRNILNLYNNVLNSLSHELRTPIATIIGACDNLQVDKTTLSEADKNELISEISKASLKLNGHVENLLNMSRLESGVIKPKLDWFDISELLFKVKIQVKEYASNHHIKIKMDDNLPLFAIDFGLIYQAIYNLVYNAILYTPAQSIILMTAIYSENNLLIIVEDNGKGFPENEIGNVFEKFFRLDESKTGGTGLGLSITKGFIEANKGTITLENKIGGGAKFQVTLPVETSRTNNLKNE